MENFKYSPRADIHRVKNNHSIYRVHRIPGLRRSKFYSGSGVEKTYNLSACDDDKEYPDDEDAVPALKEKEIGNGATNDVIRKEVEYLTLECPECEEDGIYHDKKAERFCPRCGMLLGRENAKLSDSANELGVVADKLDRTAAAAGRYQGDDDG